MRESRVHIDSIIASPTQTPVIGRGTVSCFSSNVLVEGTDGNWLCRLLRLAPRYKRPYKSVWRFVQSAPRDVVACHYRSDSVSCLQFARRARLCRCAGRDSEGGIGLPLLKGLRGGTRESLGRLPPPEEWWLCTCQTSHPSGKTQNELKASGICFIVWFWFGSHWGQTYAHFWTQGLLLKNTFHSAIYYSIYRVYPELQEQRCFWPL